MPSQIAEVSSDEFLELQRADENLKHLWEKANSVHNEEQNKDKYRFIIKNKFGGVIHIRHTGQVTS